MNRAGKPPKNNMANYAKKTRTWLLIGVTVLVALMLMFLRLPHWAEWLRPQWPVLVVLYWAMMLPERVNIGFAWVLGLLLDVWYNTPLGINALSLMLVTYFMTQFAARIKSLTYWQVSIIVLGLVILYQILPYLLQAYLGASYGFSLILSRACVSALLWPLVVFVLFNYRRKLNLETNF
jgi:rod shape-determining protein MreD